MVEPATLCTSLNHSYMLLSNPSVRPSARELPRQEVSEPPVVQRALTGLAILFLLLFLVVPLAAVFGYALEKGVAGYGSALQDPATWSAIRLTLLTEPPPLRFPST